MVLSMDVLIKILTRSLLSSAIIFSILIALIGEQIVKDKHRQFYLLMSKIEEYKQNIMLIGLISEKNIEYNFLINKDGKIEKKDTEYKYGTYSLDNDHLTQDEIVVLNMAIRTFSFLPSFLNQDRLLLYYRSYTGKKYITSKIVDDFTISEGMFNHERCDIILTCTILMTKFSLEDRILVSPIYKDIITNENIITLSSPVFKNKEIIGDFNIDMHLGEYEIIKNKTISIEKNGIYKNIVIEDDQYPFNGLSFIREYHADNTTIIKYKIPVLKILIDKYWLFLLLFLISTIITWKLMLLSDKKIKLLNAELLINKDEMTGLYNRSIFKEERFLRIKEKSNITIIAIDGNKLKFINDNYGHHVGDEAIKQIAYGMKITFRENDYLIRHGGDEFLALLPNCNLEVAEDLSIELKKNISKSRFSKHSINVEVSIGIAVSLIGEDLNYAINKADSMLYLEKEKLC
ncbi:hypothetical protein A6E05_13680 [Aliivibrio sp. 1S165]|nr:hypothetical protein A6E05_13680 [Aliivibrio sp. 1S165]OCH34331.1 hypothetical protein A6E06_00420 [Aliivibrio sp. 1S175]